MYLADIVVLLAVLFGSLVLRFGVDWPKSFGTYATGFLLATAIHIVIYYFGGLYDPMMRIGARLWLPRVSMLTLVSVLIDAAASLLSDFYLMPRGNLFILLVGASMGIAFNRWLARRLQVRRYGSPRVLLVGNPDDIHLARGHLHLTEPNVHIVGQVANLRHLAAEVERVHATDVLLLSGDTLDEIYPDPLEQLEEARVGVFQRIAPHHTLMGLRRSRQIAGMPFVALRAHTLAESSAHFKRITEMVYMLVLAVPLMLVGITVALYVRLVAGKHILFRQERVGRFGKTFQLVKFRTMTLDAEDDSGAVKATVDDPRVVPGMGWVRRTRMDELPQFLNVLKGEMSIVGPRPERPEFAARYEEIIPGYGRRHDIPPGITGLAQVSGNYHTDPGYKLGHDLQYLVNWSPILDVQIMLQTVWTVLRGKL
jgi:lipopolysaccharide/colanic/teichoic acid biosynthesis glycosyltransferase